MPKKFKLAKFITFYEKNAIKIIFALKKVIKMFHALNNFCGDFIIYFDLNVNTIHSLFIGVLSICRNVLRIVQKYIFG